MDEINALLKPIWGAEKWILEGWNAISCEEKASIKTRMDDLFKDGLPFEIEKDRLMYIYTFSVCAQLECLAIQIPLRFEDKMTVPRFKQQLRRQLLDELFHAMLFTKIVYMLSAPAAFPPEYSKKIEILCDFIRNEECPKLGIVLLNLVGEGWLEVFFRALCNENIAPRVMSIVLDDESRHIQEADLYCELGLPNKDIMREKLETMEALMLNCLVLEPKYFMAFGGLLGKSATNDYFHSLNENYIKQLKKVNMVPSKRWVLDMDVRPKFFDQMFAHEGTEIEMSPIRQVCMTQWNNTGDPTMVGQFNIDVSCLDFFSKKYPPETLTTLMLQAVSQLLMGEASFRNYLSYKRLHQSENAYVAVLAKLPDCNSHTATIVFKDCHLMTVANLAATIRQVMEMMAYCYKKREEIEASYPYLKASIDEMLFDCAHGAYPYPIPGNAITSVSNIGVGGFSQAISPLRRHEALKFTLLAIERRPTWSNATNTFEPRDMLPISMSSDHRVFDGNWPIQKLVAGCFQQVFQQMLSDKMKPVEGKKGFKMIVFKKILDHALSTNLEMGYQMVVMLQTQWPSYLNIEELFNNRVGVGSRHEATASQ